MLLLMPWMLLLWQYSLLVAVAVTDAVVVVGNIWFVDLVEVVYGY